MLRNYRQIMNNRNTIAWGSGKSQNGEGNTNSPLVAYYRIYPFEIQRITFVSQIKGYIVFVGAYRNGERYLLRDFTILHESTSQQENFIQTCFIAIKKVEKYEEVRFDQSIARFGGTIYGLYSDLAQSQITTGKGIVSQIGDRVSFPIAANYSINFGIISHIYNQHVIDDADNPDVILIKYSENRVNTFYSLDFMRYMNVNGLITISRGINHPYPTDIDSIWVQFTL